MKKLILLFCFCKAFLHADPFYQNPSPEAVYQWLDKKGFNQATENDLPRTSLLATTFIAQVIKAHPNYTETFARDFPRFSSMEKAFFSQAFSTAGIQDPSLQGDEISPIVSLSELDHLEFKSSDDFDLMCVSFIATGDELFLSQLMAFLNTDPEFLPLAHEFRQLLDKNENELTLDDIKFVETIKSWSKEKQELFILKLTAWKCLDFIKAEDPSAEEKISQLCKNNPKLDYQGTLTKLLN
jgi:hypothetical protein